MKIPGKCMSGILDILKSVKHVNIIECDFLTDFAGLFKLHR